MGTISFVNWLSWFWKILKYLIYILTAIEGAHFFSIISACGTTCDHNIDDNVVNTMQNKELLTQF